MEELNIELKKFLDKMFNVSIYKHGFNIGLFLVLGTILSFTRFSISLLIVIILIIILNIISLSLWRRFKNNWKLNQYIQAKRILRFIKLLSIPVMLFPVPDSYIQIKKTEDGMEFFAEKYFSKDVFLNPKFDYDFRKNTSYLGFLINFMLYGTVNYTTDSINKAFKMNKNRLLKTYLYHIWFNYLFSFLVVSIVFIYILIYSSLIISVLSTPVYLILVMFIINIIQFILIMYIHLFRLKYLYSIQNFRLLFILSYPLFPMGFHYRTKRDIFKYLKHKD